MMLKRFIRGKAFRIITVVLLISILVCAFGMVAYAAGDVAGAVNDTWTKAQTQIKSIVDKVVFPVIDLVLAVFFFVKLGTAYFDYRKNGQFEWSAPAILFGCLVFTLTCPLYIWNVLGM